MRDGANDAGFARCFVSNARMLFSCFAKVEQEYVDRFSFIDRMERRVYHAMVAYIDEAIGKVVVALRDTDMYANTLIVFASDNGGPVYLNGSAGANNHPLRGGKMSNWEGLVGRLVSQKPSFLGMPTCRLPISHTLANVCGYGQTYGAYYQAYGGHAHIGV